MSDTLRTEKMHEKMKTNMWVIEDLNSGTENEEQKPFDMVIHIRQDATDTMDTKKTIRSYETIVELLEAIATDLKADLEFYHAAQELIDDGKVEEYVNDDGERMYRKIA